LKIISLTQQVVIFYHTLYKIAQSYSSNVIIICAVKALAFHKSLTSYWRRKAQLFLVIRYLISSMIRK